ncbi:MAG: UBP-type zinc finger domain-containing protein, partial [Propionibacterium sp.]|nr:UBP-type zinc finger domain-containing protein [Propionibacterium sp.]
MSAEAINTDVPASGDGCCDSSPGQHATGHYEATGHQVMQSFEPGEGWMWDFEKQKGVPFVQLA